MDVAIVLVKTAVPSLSPGGAGGDADFTVSVDLADLSVSWTAGREIL